MADESDDARDIARYWHILGEGYDAVFGSRFIKGGGVVDYPDQVRDEPPGEPVHQDAVSHSAERHDERLQVLPDVGPGWVAPLLVAAFQSHGRAATEDDRARL